MEIPSDAMQSAADEIYIRVSARLIQHYTVIGVWNFGISLFVVPTFPFFFIFSTFYLFPAPASSTPSPNSSLHSSLLRPLPGPLPSPSPLPPFSSILQLQCNVIYLLRWTQTNGTRSCSSFPTDLPKILLPLLINARPALCGLPCRDQCQRPKFLPLLYVILCCGFARPQLLRTRRRSMERHRKRESEQ